MSTFVLIHGAGDTGWSWHLVAAALRTRGHEVVVPDLPGGDDSLTLHDYADAVVASLTERSDLVVVAHSFGGFTGTLVAARLPVKTLVFVAGMIPLPGEAPDDWWKNTGYGDAVAKQAARDGGATGNKDPYVSFYNDVPRELTIEALSKERAHPSPAAGAAPWPLLSLPNVPTRFIVCTRDQFFPPDFMRRVANERLGIVADEIDAGHCVALSRPKELAVMLDGYTSRGPETSVSTP